MLAGKTRAALRLLDRHGQSRVLPITEPVNNSADTVLDVLRLKHPPGQPVHPEAVITDTTQQSIVETHPILFDDITGQRLEPVDLQARPAWIPVPGRDYVALLRAPRLIYATP